MELRRLVRRELQDLASLIERPPLKPDERRDQLLSLGQAPDRVSYRSAGVLIHRGVESTSHL